MKTIQLPHYLVFFICSLWLTSASMAQESDNLDENKVTSLSKTSGDDVDVVKIESKTDTKVSKISAAIITKKVKGKYFEVVQNIRTSILGKGIHIAHELHASDMLRRTSIAYGYEKQIYTNAQILEFCSAKLSQKLSRIDPDNLVMCPFTIGVYTLTDDKDHVFITYRIPYGKPGTEEVSKDIVELISGIIEDAMW